MKDRDLVRLYWPVELRPAFDALFNLDDAMGDVVMRSTQPALAAIKLAWWRERLEQMDKGSVPAEPRLAAVARELLPKGITGAELAELEAGWATLLAEWPESRLIAARGEQLFVLAGRLLGTPPAGLRDAGALYAVVDAGRRRGNPGDLSLADEVGSLRFARPARPLTGLAALAERDLRRTGRNGFESEGTPARAWTLIRHRLTGRL